MIRNKKVENAINTLYSQYEASEVDEIEHLDDAMKVVETYIEQLERENFGLRTKVENYGRKEEARKREMGWVRD